jgi:IstB-like ATP binding protein
MGSICLIGSAAAAEMTGSEIEDLITGKTLYTETTAESVTGTPGRGVIYYAADGRALVPLSPTGAELLFEVFSQRYERGSIIVTSHLAFEDWTSIFGSERLTGALLDRLTHHVDRLDSSSTGSLLGNARTTLKNESSERRRAFAPARNGFR